MKIFLACAAAVVMTVAGAVSAAAFPGLGIDATVSVPSPMGDFADGAKTGIGAGADAFFGLPMLPLKVGGRVAWNRFPHEVGDGNTSIIEVLPSVRYGFGLPFGTLSAFLQAGAGVYASSIETKILGKTVTDYTSDFGIAVGAGVSVMTIPSVKVLALPMYHIIFSDTKISYYSLNVGLTF